MEELKKVLEILESRKEIQFKDLRKKWTREKSAAYENTMNEINTLKKSIKIIEQFIN